MNENFIADNIIQSVAPLYLIGKILGISPFTIINHEDIKLSWICSAFSFAVFSNLLASFIINTSHIRTNRDMQKLISIIDHVSYATATLIFFLCRMISAKKYFTLLKKISRLDQTFKTVNIIFLHGNFKKKIILILSFGFIFEVIMIVSSNALQYITGGYVTYYGLFVHIWDKACKMCLLIKSYAIADSLTKRFEAINKELDNYKNNKVMGNEKKINVLRYLHDELCDVCEFFNEVESLPNLSLLGLVFVVTITNSYYFYSHWYNHGGQIELSSLRTILTVAHFAFYGVFLFPFFVRLSKEANRTGIAVHKILRRIDDPKAEYELNIFSKQLLHRNVYFTANGFFPLDYTFLFSMAGTITTYLIILIQFQNVQPTSSTSINTNASIQR